MAWVSDQFYINNLIHLSFNSTEYDNLTDIQLNDSAIATGYTLSFDPPLTVNMTNYNGEVSEVSMLLALNWM
jgi:hypothetical protein